MHPKSANPPEPSPLDPWIPRWDARERHAVTIRAPALLAFQAAAGLDFESVRLVRAIIRLRARLLGGRPAPREPRPFLEEMREKGWQVLVERPGELLVAGATCQPWLGDVVFHPLPADAFAAFAEPGQVKIAWTLEAHPAGPDRTVFATETRAVATDPEARARFRRYWRWARFGIVSIRWLILPEIRRRAEAEWRGRR